MGQRVKGDLWCDFCSAPTLGTKTTHRLRAAAVAATIIPTAGASGAFARVERYKCSRCGQPVRRASQADFDRLVANPPDGVGAPPASLDPSPELDTPSKPSPLKSPDKRKAELRYMVDSRADRELKASLKGLLETFAPGRFDTASTRETIAKELETVGLAIREELATAKGAVTICDARTVPSGGGSVTPVHSAAERTQIQDQLRQIEEYRAAGRLSEVQYTLVRQRLLSGGPITKSVVSEQPTS